MKLNIRIGHFEFENPVTVASGTFGLGEKYSDVKQFAALGALVPKTVTLNAQEGNPPPRILETPAGMMNAIGIANPGVDVFIKEKVPFLKKLGAPLVISVLGYSDQEFVKIVKKMNSVDDIAALELNLSCPNLKQKKLVAQDPKLTYRLIKKVKAVSRFPVIAKLSPNVTDISCIAQAAEDAGADAVSLVNTFTALAIDIHKRKPILGNGTGGLSGPAIKPIAVYMVHRVAQKVQIPIVAMGGILTPQDALEFIIAGATMVSVGTVNFIDPLAPLKVLQGIKDYMKKNNIKKISDLIGSLQF